MSKLALQATEQLRGAIREAMQKAMESGTLPKAPLPEFTVEIPADRTHGDWATNAAMVGAKSFRFPRVKLLRPSRTISTFPAPISTVRKLPDPAF